ncbi:MAG: hypothetical protein HXS53_04705 [Theionarchaea archaeon]|nr:hypothetical protein [Theionarchaea archaeon]
MVKKWKIAGLISLLLVISFFSLYLKINVLEPDQKPKYNPLEPHDYPGTKKVFIHGTIGWLSIPGPYNLFWECNGLFISLTADLSGGREAAENEMIKIAESMSCEFR